MKEFFEENKIFLAIISGATIISVGIYFGLQNYSKVKTYSSFNIVSGENVLKVDNISRCLAESEVLVTKVIDGDTIVVEGGYHVRLLDIDADEKGLPCYQDAKTRLEELVLNKKIWLEKDKTDVDQYKRCLRYVFLDKQNIDLQLVKEGLAIARFYEPDIKYKNEITLAEKTAINAKIGCKWKK
ncbi:MAG: thermonuclease family protein [Candidatus Staskawiczbacteria bacterium]|nr:thermonuclease family protein [Candidatus Staskawiczbacteria bacterium]